MFTRENRITQEVRKVDPLLYAVRTNAGMIQVWRKADKPTIEGLTEFEDSSKTGSAYFVLALTDNFKLTGRPVDIGLEPLSRKLREMDTWSDPDQFTNMVKRRDNETKDKERTKSNNMRAIAADLRKDFAAATNDVVVRH